MPERQMLVLVVPRELRDDLVDTLVSTDLVSGFNLGQIAGFSREHSRFSLREQVVGYRELFRFEIVHDSDGRDALMSALAPVCERTHCRYWLLPLLQEGHFGPATG
jgi:hypothetical protein